jgi:hypothetical protein
MTILKTSKQPAGCMVELSARSSGQLSKDARAWWSTQLIELQLVQNIAQTYA